MTRPTPGPPSRCSKCKQPISWWRNANREGRLPVDLSSDDEKGTIRKIVTQDPETGKPVIYGQKLTPDEVGVATADGEMLFTHHSDTCTSRRPHNPKPAGLELNLPRKNKNRR